MSRDPRVLPAHSGRWCMNTGNGVLKFRKLKVKEPQKQLHTFGMYYNDLFRSRFLKRKGNIYLYPP